MSLDDLVTTLKHMAGKHSQKRHGWRFGSTAAAKASMRDQPKDEREAYKKSARAKAKKLAGQSVSVEGQLSSNKYRLTKKHDEANVSLGGITQSYLVNVEGDGKAIVKPEMSSFASDSIAEVASYEVSKALGFDIVPETVLRPAGTYPNPNGTTSNVMASAQAWVEGSKTAAEIAAQTLSGVPIPPIDERSLSRMMILDHLIGNADRHDGNLLISPEGKITAIDHGLTFKASPIPHLPEFDDMKYWVKSTMKQARGDGPFQYHPDDITALSNLGSNTQLRDSITRQYGKNRWDDMVNASINMVGDYKYGPSSSSSDSSKPDYINTADWETSGSYQGSYSGPSVPDWMAS